MIPNSQDVQVRRTGVTDAAKRICTAYTLSHLDRGEESLQVNIKVQKALGQNLL